MAKKQPLTAWHRATLDLKMVEQISADAVGFVRHDAVVDQEFVVVPDHEGRLDFDLRTAWSPRMLDAFLASDADGLVANYALGLHRP